jgi:lipoate-protein ligase A
LPGDPIDLIVERRLAPAASVGEDRALLAAARRTGRPALRVYDCAGTMLSLGRYHLAPDPGPGGDGVVLARRLSGGRAVPSGEGFVGVALAVPHRSAPFASDPLALAPEQVMNRHVRGILEGLRLAGLPAHYPGRDRITVEGRVLGLVSFEVDASGALIFEAVLSSGRDFALLPALLDAVDPAGVVPAEMVAPGDAVSLVAALGRALDPPEVAELLVRGYGARLGWRFVEAPAPAPVAVDAAAWVGERRRRRDLRLLATVRGQLGVVEVHGSIARGRIAEVLLGGDFIANSPAIARLEAALRGLPAEAAPVRAAVEEVFASPENFLLGLGPVEALADALVRGLAP